MSDEKAAPKHGDIERIETISNTSTPWGVRLGFAIAGLVLLAGAFVAWQFRGSMNAGIADAVPWVIAAAVVLGAGAIMESITVEIWMALIVGAFAVVIAFIIVGRVVVYPGQGQSLFVVERYTGEVEYCTADSCKVLPRSGSLTHEPKFHAPKVK